MPYLDPSVILGGGYFPTVGVVDTLRAGTLMRDQARPPARSPSCRAPKSSTSPEAGRVAGS